MQYITSTQILKTYSSDDNKEFVFNQFKSLYIHCIFQNATEDEIINDYFHYNNIGCIDKIDWIKQTNNDGKIYYSIFIHFTNWYNTTEAYNLQSEIFFNNRAVRNYKDNYWIINFNKNQPPLSETQLQFIIQQKDKIIQHQQAQLQEKENIILQLQEQIINKVVIEEDKNDEIEKPREEEDVYQEDHIETSKSYYNYCWEDRD